MSTDISILYADTHLVVINKPSGLLSVPGRGENKQDCVVSRVKLLYPDMIEQPAVHRLDMQTSGIMVLARSKETHRELSRQFEKRLIHKMYIALVEGKVHAQEGKIELKFRLDITNRPYQIYDPVQGKPGITLWKKIGTEETATRIAMHPITGRTHQLRLHAAHHLGLGCPIIGDTLYGNGREGETMMLHASLLRLIHPGCKKEMTFHSAPPF